MRTLTVFNNVTLDGYFTGPNGDLSWAKQDPKDDEWNAFVAENARAGSTLLFGRVTYELMASYWPTPAASRNAPVVAERMNGLPKVVFSRTLVHVGWSNTALVKGELEEEIRTMKSGAGGEMTILGSGSIVSQLAQGRLIDEYQVVVHPVVLGQGRTMFDGVKERLGLKLTRTRSFRNGSVFLCYEPSA
jgi:dihydrofolate reductase